MSETEFCRWLQGFCELHGEPPTKEQWESIKQHLQLCYHKVTPLLSGVHDGGKNQLHYAPYTQPNIGGCKPASFC